MFRVGIIIVYILLFPASHVQRHYMRNLHYTDPKGEKMSFNERGDLPSEWSLANLVLYKTVTRYKIFIDHVITNDESLNYGPTNSIALGEIKWKEGKDSVALISSVTASSFSAITLFILRNFIYYWNTPIVKANNRAVSLILLISILLSFLCVFLFLGRPVDITCRLRQTSFGIFFSTAVSSVLAKTVTVCIAFKATKPGSPWRKWITLKVSNYVVIVCSSVQALICGIWLSVSPPYQEYDHHSYQGMIIIQCNEGSVIGLYSMLGYMGILAAVSFVLAFMVRTLPDNFNEAKYITFSMLVFCSVWISMIPAYLSTKGKYTVAVEIFAILTSCAGVLGCIFFPKLYILLLKPEMNSRKMMLEKDMS
ncbi:vomeronasal type-2 receptor 26-like [Pseudophryne corroboree]|uniref:vomeronasal type-2 receptor 26-like n=1 Tax=Pseudophryne corroboree TaxID=495146 RepID=UPI0030812E4F